MQKSHVKATVAAICAAAMAAGTVFASLAADDAAAPQAPLTDFNAVMMDASVAAVEDGRLTIKKAGGEGYADDIIVTVADDTKVLDAVNGYPIALENLAVGEAVRVYCGPAMTMSIPPITNGVLILGDVPEDAAFPVYTAVADYKKANGPGYSNILTVADGTQYTLTWETELLPYLTRNIVTTDDLTKDTEILIWANADGQAKKIVIFQKETDAAAEEEEPAVGSDEAVAKPRANDLSGLRLVAPVPADAQTKASAPEAAEPSATQGNIPDGSYSLYGPGY